MANLDFIAPTGKFEDWNVYKLSLIIVDITDLFVKTYFPKYGDRTVDQMVQAARSCKQNIVEGSVAASTSRETELKLTNVAKASLAELSQDYQDYLRHNDLKQWPVTDPRVSEIRRFARKHDKPDIYLTKLRERNPEAFCNIALTLCHQLDYMLYCVMERAKAIFLQKGGIKEEMYRARIAVRNEYQRNQRNQRNQSFQRDQRNQSFQSNQRDQRNQSNQRDQSHQSYHQSDQSNQRNPKDSTGSE